MNAKEKAVIARYLNNIWAHVMESGKKQGYKADHWRAMALMAYSLVSNLACDLGYYHDRKFRARENK